MTRAERVAVRETMIDAVRRLVQEGFMAADWSARHNGRGVAYSFEPNDREVRAILGKLVIPAIRKAMRWRAR